jgi:hypothetical protein
VPSNIKVVFGPLGFEPVVGGLDPIGQIPDRPRVYVYENPTGPPRPDYGPMFKIPRIRQFLATCDIVVYGLWDEYSIATKNIFSRREIPIWGAHTSHIVCRYRTLTILLELHMENILVKDNITDPTESIILMYMYSLLFQTAGPGIMEVYTYLDKHPCDISKWLSPTSLLKNDPSAARIQLDVNEPS